MDQNVTWFCDSDSDSELIFQFAQQNTFENEILYITYIKIAYKLVEPAIATQSCLPTGPIFTLN